MQSGGKGTWPHLLGCPKRRQQSPTAPMEALWVLHFIPGFWETWLLEVLAVAKSLLQSLTETFLFCRYYLPVNIPLI